MRKTTVDFVDKDFINIEMKSDNKALLNAALTLFLILLTLCGGVLFILFNKDTSFVLPLAAGIALFVSIIFMLCAVFKMRIELSRHYLHIVYSGPLRWSYTKKLLMTELESCKRISAKDQSKLILKAGKKQIDISPLPQLESRRLEKFIHRAIETVTTK